MAFVQANLVLETTTTTGTGSISLDGAQQAAQTFVAGIGDGNTCDYCIRGQGDWEVGRGTVSSGTPDTLSRDTVYDSSNGGSKVNFASGTKDVYCVIPIDDNGCIPDGDFGTLKEQGARVGPIESGTWSPTIEGSTTAGSHTYSTQYGSYQRRGNVIHILEK